MTSHDIARHERVEMYLKALFMMEGQGVQATASRVAEHMSLSVPSAYEMLKRLEGRGLVGPMEEGYRLTETGRAQAARVVRRLRLAERLLTDVLHLDLPSVYAEACKMEHVISEEVEARLADVLGHPPRCPHGLPIPDAVPLPGAVSLPGAAPDPHGADIPLDTLIEGQRGRIVTVPEEDTALLAYLWEIGLRPGAEVGVVEVAPFDGPITVRVGGREQALDHRAAARVRVQPAS